MELLVPCPNCSKKFAPEAFSSHYVTCTMVPTQKHDHPSVLQNNPNLLNKFENSKPPIKTSSTQKRFSPIPTPANVIRKTLDVNFTKLHSICNRIARDHYLVKDVGNLAILLAANDTEQLEKIPPFFPTEIHVYDEPPCKVCPH